ncbi:uncharacterized protein LOC120533247 isoform X1 [Polypterus senegalus]|uniref:uncharacterized protein LOC120533247 isoform X1 n=1 Tax=Polypterus senegalus TaxID=55291 RepID=UPI0019633F71|nr:uncharacterized protein LOC120533247 isoform X1 [Polypterus senegalus]XP_039615959.1 uncharacterized protein LOC120533247 isoform X1 [Polypterus senegalus]
MNTEEMRNVDIKEEDREWESIQAVPENLSVKGEDCELGSVAIKEETEEKPFILDLQKRETKDDHLLSESALEFGCPSGAVVESASSRNGHHSFVGQCVNVKSESFISEQAGSEEVPSRRTLEDQPSSASHCKESESVTVRLQKGEFAVEHGGDLISTNDCRRQQHLYHDVSEGLMCDFKCNGNHFCNHVDAAREDLLGISVNADRVNPNCKVKRIAVEGKPRLCLFAIRDISPGEEITCDYGSGDWPWRCKVTEMENPPNAGSAVESVKDEHNSASGSSSIRQALPTANRTVEVNENKVEKPELAHFSSCDKQVDMDVSGSDSDTVVSDEMEIDSSVPRVQGSKRIILAEKNLNPDASLINTLESTNQDCMPISLNENSSEYSSSAEGTPPQCKRPRRCWKAEKKHSSSDSTPNICSSEDVTESNTEPQSLSVKAVSKNLRGHRLYNKKQYCLYCSRPVLKMARHLEQVHSEEKEVVEALQFPKNSKERKKQLDHLRNRGNFAHNHEVIQSGSGDLIPCKQPQKPMDSKDFMHCANCQGLFARKFLWCHMKRCKLKTLDEAASKPGKNRVQSTCAFASPMPPGVSCGLWKILSVMVHDEVLLAIKSDPFIIQLGEHLYGKVGSDASKHEYVRQKLREVGRLLCEARKMTPLRTMEDFVNPSNFLHVVCSVKNICGYNEGTCTFKTPSLALKLGHNLQKISCLVESQAMKQSNSTMAKTARNFRQMYGTRWSKMISSNALKMLRDATWDVPQVLPFTEDVRKMHVYLDEKQEEYYQKLMKEASGSNWIMLSKVTLAQVILFNQRQKGEVSGMLLSTFSCRDKTVLHEDNALVLPELEKRLYQHYTRLEIQGKKGRKVQILLTPAVQRAMDLLVDKRQSCGVSRENIYMFARLAALSHIRGSDCIRVFANECGAKDPNALTSAKFGKHVATLSKVLTLSDAQLDQLADFLGHDVRVCQQYYRLPEGTLHLARISKLLMALEKGKLGEFKGKKMEDINIDPDDLLQVHSDHSGSEDELGDDEENRGLDKSKRRKCCKPYKNVQKRKWDDSEVKAVEKHLGKFIRTCKVPGKKECERCLTAEPEVLRTRDWRGVKFFVKNRITALRKKL